MLTWHQLFNANRKKTYYTPNQMKPVSNLKFLFVAIVSLVCSFPAYADFPAPQKVAPNVYAFIGATEEASAQNRGAVANQGFIVGDSGIIVIDTGGSDEYGEHMLRAIAKISDKPVVLVITTFTGQDHVLGNGAFKRNKNTIVSTRDADKSMAQHCADCLANLKKNIGEDIMANTRVNRPTLLLEQSIQVKIAGRDLEIISLGHSNAPGVLAVYDRTSSVLFAGDLFSFDRLPETREAKIDGWLAAIEALKKLPLKQIVPGHGLVAKPVRMAEVTAYLRALKTQAETLYRDGVSLGEVTKRAELPAYSKWALYDLLHRRNVFNLYLELEAHEFAK
jgi:glyoxylase-like metal-dependent hydrolase (beta-lactamase superfamily II)